MVEETQNTPPITQEDEIDLIQILKRLWNGRKTIIWSVVICAVIGVAVALLSPKAYTVTSTMVPQVSSKSNNLGGLSSLASLAGFNLDLSSGAGPLSPTIYPQIIESVPFQLELMNTPFTFSETDRPVSIYEYYTEIAKPGFFSIIAKYTIGLPGVIISAIKGKEELNIGEGQQIIFLTEEQEEIRKIIAENVSLNTNTKEGYITLSVTMPEALTAAEVAVKTQEMLQKYLTDVKIAKAQDQLNFVEGRYVETKKEFEAAQKQLAAFRDRNKNVSSAVARTEEERLQGEYNIAYTVYSELAKQLEQAKLQVKEDSPILSIVKPVIVPIEKSKPKRAMILFIWTFLGCIMGIGIVFGKHYLKNFRKQWQEEEQVIT